MRHTAQFTSIRAPQKKIRKKDMNLISNEKQRKEEEEEGKKNKKKKRSTIEREKKKIKNPLHRVNPKFIDIIKTYVILYIRHEINTSRKKNCFKIKE